MKLNKIIIIVFLIYMVSCVFVNPQAINIYAPKYLKKEFGEENKTFPVSPGSQKFGIGITHGLICGLPLKVSDVFKNFKNTFKGSLALAGFIDQGFTLLLSVFGLNSESNFVSKENLEERLLELFEDLKVYVENRIDAEKFVFSQIQYSKLRVPLQNFRDLQIIMDYETNKTGMVSYDTKTSIVSVYWVLLTELEEAIIELSHPSRIYQTYLLYLESAILYGVALKDGLNYGNQMELPKYLINETTGENASLFKKFEDLLKNVLEKWPQLINTLLKTQIERKKSNIDDRKKTNYNTSVNRDKFKIPSKGELVSSFHYSNLELYPNPIYFVNENNLDSGKTIYGLEYNKLNIDAPINSIYVIDPLVMKIGISSTSAINNLKYNVDNKNHGYEPFKKIEQKNDFLTGLNGYLNGLKNIYNCFSLELKFSNQTFKESIYFRYIYTDPTEYDYDKPLTSLAARTLPTFRLYFHESKSGESIPPGYPDERRIILTKKYEHVSGRYLDIIGPYDFSKLRGDIIVEVCPTHEYNAKYAFIAFEIVATPQDLF